MKYLVLWIKANPPTTSILDENQVKITEKFVRAKWGKSWQDVKVIEENGKKFITYYFFLQFNMVK